MDGDAAVEVQRVVELAQAARLPARHPQEHTEGAARRDGSGALAVNAVAGSRPG